MAHMVQQIIKYSDGTETVINYRGVIENGELTLNEDIIVSDEIKQEVAEEAAPEVTVEVAAEVAPEVAPEAASEAEGSVEVVEEA